MDTSAKTFAKQTERKTKRANESPINENKIIFSSSSYILILLRSKLKNMNYDTNTSCSNKYENIKMAQRIKFLPETEFLVQIS